MGGRARPKLWKLDPDFRIEQQAAGRSRGAAERRTGAAGGSGLFGFGFVLEGGTYAENVSIGMEMGCEPFGGSQHNMTNFFCCSGETPPGRLLPRDHR